MRGSEFTLTAEHDGGITHVIEGTGYVDVKGHKEFTYPAGLGVDIRGTSVAITTSWPTAAQALVPAADRPPKLRVSACVTPPSGAARSCASASTGPPRFGSSSYAARGC